MNRSWLAGLTALFLACTRRHHFGDRPRCDAYRVAKATPDRLDCLDVRASGALSSVRYGVRAMRRREDAR